MTSCEKGRREDDGDERYHVKRRCESREKKHRKRDDEHRVKRRIKDTEMKGMVGKEV